MFWVVQQVGCRCEPSANQTCSQWLNHWTIEANIKTFLSFIIKYQIVTYILFTTDLHQATVGVMQLLYLYVNMDSLIISNDIHCLSSSILNQNKVSSVTMLTFLKNSLYSTTKVPLIYSSSIILFVCLFVCLFVVFYLII